MRILFLGAGAVGGYFGGRLTQSGSDVTFLVRERRSAQLADGLRIESPKGDATIPVKTIQSGDSADPFDIIVLTCKAYGLPGALEAIAPHIDDSTPILPLLNGVAHVEAIQARFPRAITLGGVAQIPAELKPDGTVLHHAPLNNIMAGSLDGGAGHDTVANFVAALQDAGVNATHSDRITQDLWDKWIFLTTLAAGTCLMRSPVAPINQTDHGTSIMEALLAECSAVVSAEGHPPEDERMDFYRNAVTQREGYFKASMLTDMEAGHPTEADHIFGDMIRRAASHQIDVPLLKVAYTHMQVYETGRKAG